MTHLPRLACIVAMAFAVATSARAAGYEVINPDQAAVELEVHRGNLVRLPEPATAVFIADPEIADVAVKSPTLVHVTGKQAGETSLFAVNEAEEVLADVRLVVTHNLTRLREALDELIIGNAIQIDSVSGGVLLKGPVETAAEADEARQLATQFINPETERVINQLSIIGPNQVNLRVRVAEVSRDVLKNLNFDFEAVANVGDFAFGVLSGSGINSVGGRSNRASVAFDGTDLDANFLIDALEDEGLVTVLAEPNLTAMSGETARFLAGGEFPIPIAQEDNRITIEFKEFGVSLVFTPTIVGSGRINLRVIPEVSALSNNGAVEFDNFVIPALTTRRTDTRVELASGQSLAIAGLLQSNTTTDLSEYPGLGDLPVLGALFRSSEFQSQETELVIIVTPYLVRPVSAIALASPTDGFNPASDIDRTINGRNYQETPRSRRPVLRTSAASTGHVGPLGFTLE